MLGLHEPGHERVGWTLDEVGQRSALHHASVAHQQDIVGQCSSLVQVVRDPQHGLAEGIEQVAQFALQVVPGDRIECRQRLVAQQQWRVRQQGACDAHALALAAGQRGWVLVEQPRVDMREFDDRGQPRGDAPAVPSQVACEQRDVVARGQVREQPAILDHVAGPVAYRFHRCRAEGHAVDLDRSGVRRQQADQQPQQRGLAAAAGTEQHGHAPAFEMRAERGKRLALPECAAQPVGADHPPDPVPPSGPAACASGCRPRQASSAAS